MAKEIWADILGYEGYYQASSEGRIKSLPRKFRPTEKILKATTNKYGYVHIDLCYNGFIETKLVHRLVMLAFVGYSKLTVNHKNGIKGDNRLSNLEYATRRGQNIDHFKRVDTASNFSGVTRQGKKWRARLWFKGKEYYFGTYTSQELAFEAFKEGYKKLHGVEYDEENFILM